MSQKSITLKNILTLDEDKQMLVRDIRNEENVRKWMYTDHEVTQQEHLNWIASLAKKSNQAVFVVLDEQETPMGVVSVNDLDKNHKKSDWAYYLTQAARGGLGSALEFHFINFLFDEFGIEKLNCEVIEGNDAVVKLHKKFLFLEEGFRRSNIIKNGERIGVHFLGLTKEDWENGKDELTEKYGGSLAKFDINIVNI